MKILILAKSTILLLCFTVTSAWAETAISSLPYTITASGTYYLTGDLTSTGVGITVSANYVTIDLKGYSLIGSGVADAAGIVASFGSGRMVIKNGTIRYFDVGIQSENAAGEFLGVSNVNVTKNIGSGMALSGHNNLIENCAASDNGGDGINVGAGSSVLKSVAYNNVKNGINAYEGATIIGNTAYGNGLTGLVAGSGSTMSQNTSHSNVGHGLYCYISCTLVENTAYGNQGNGISWVARSTVKNNTTNNNVGYGILLGDTSNSLVDGNTAMDNGTNMGPCSTCTFGINQAP